MTSWMEERDRLVATTLAFVQEVAAAHPAPARVVADKPAIEAAEVTQGDVALPATAAVAPAPVVASSEIQFAPETNGAKPRPLATLISERDDIMRRVEAFRTRQSRIIEEREAYYQSVKARIRNVLGNDSKDGRL